MHPKPAGYALFRIRDYIQIDFFSEPGGADFPDDFCDMIVTLWGMAMMPLLSALGDSWCQNTL